MDWIQMFERCSLINFSMRFFWYITHILIHSGSKVMILNLIRALATVTAPKLSRLEARKSFSTPMNLPSAQRTTPSKLPMPRLVSFRRVYSAKGSTPSSRRRTRPQPAPCTNVKPQARKQPLLAAMGNQAKNTFNGHLRRAPIERLQRKAQRK